MAMAPHKTRRAPALVIAAVFALLMTLVGPSGSSATTNANLCDTAQFNRIYYSDFTRRSDLDGWSLYNSAGHAGNGLRRPSAVTTMHGKLVVTARNQDGVTVSGGLSRPSLSQTYGCYRFRVRTDRDFSNVTSGVVMTWPTYGTKAAHGENDVYETTHNWAMRTPFMTFIHKPGDFSGRAAQQHWYRHYADANRYQTMTMVWTPNEMTIRREGPDASGWHTTDTHSVREENVPHVAHHPAIQLDARNKGQLARPVRLEIDWIEVYDYVG